MVNWCLCNHLNSWHNQELWANRTKKRKASSLARSRLQWSPPPRHAVQLPRLSMHRPQPGLRCVPSSQVAASHALGKNGRVNQLLKDKFGDRKKPKTPNTAAHALLAEGEGGFFCAKELAKEFQNLRIKQNAAKNILILLSRDTPTSARKHFEVIDTHQMSRQM